MSLHHIGSVNTSFFCSQTAVGGTGGNSFSCNTDASNFAAGTVVRSLTFFSDKNQLRACYVQLTDNNKVLMYGKVTGEVTESDTFVFGNGEKLTSLTIYGNNYNGGSASAVAWKTSADRAFFFGLCASSATVTYESDVGSGYLVGIFGNQSTGLNSLGFAVLRTIMKAKLTSVKYDLDSTPVDPVPQSIKTISYDNLHGSIDQIFTFAGKDSVIQSSSWSITAGVQVGLELQIEGGIPLLYSEKAKAFVKVSVSSTYQRTSTQTSEESFSFPIHVPAGKIVKATAKLIEANIVVPYTAKAVYTLDTGNDLTANTSGTYEGVDYDTVIVTVKELEEEDLRRFALN